MKKALPHKSWFNCHEADQTAKTIPNDPLS